MIDRTQRNKRACSTFIQRSHNHIEASLFGGPELLLDLLHLAGTKRTLAPTLQSHHLLRPARCSERLEIHPRCLSPQELQPGWHMISRH